MKWYIRLKPYNKRTGCVVRRWITSIEGTEYMFITHPEYQVPYWYVFEDQDALVEYFATLKQIEDDPMASPLFDIVNEERYNQVAREEEVRRKVEAGQMSATTAYADTRMNPVDRAPKATGRAAAVPDAAVAAPRPMSVEEVFPSASDAPVAGDLTTKDFKSPKEATAKAEVPTLAVEDSGQQVPVEEPAVQESSYADYSEESVLVPPTPHTEGTHPRTVVERPAAKAYSRRIEPTGQ